MEVKSLTTAMKCICEFKTYLNDDLDELNKRMSH